MNKKALYNAIMKNVATLVKKALNESIDIHSDDNNIINSIDPSLIEQDNKGNDIIDLSDLSILPQDVIDSLVHYCIQNGILEEYDSDNNIAYVSYYIADDDNIIAKSLNAYGVSVSAAAEFIFDNPVYYAGSPRTNEYPGDDEDVEFDNNINVYDVKLSDGGDYDSIDITDEDIIESIKNDLDGGDIQQERLKNATKSYLDGDDYDWDDIDD